jgi:hypothetical protein
MHLGKSVENRRLKWSYEGPIWLHEAVGGTRPEYEEACTWMESRRLAQRESHRVELGAHLPILPPYEDIPRRGGIVGRARIVGRLDKHTGARSSLALVGADYEPRWWMADQHGYVLADVTAVPFVPLRGMLGLFTVPADVLARLAAP